MDILCYVNQTCELCMPIKVAPPLVTLVASSRYTFTFIFLRKEKKKHGARLSTNPLYKYHRTWASPSWLSLHLRVTSLRTRAPSMPHSSMLNAIDANWENTTLCVLATASRRVSPGRSSHLRVRERAPTHSSEGIVYEGGRGFPVNSLVRGIERSGG